MKGDLAVCASPRCNKEFIKTRINQKCCGNASCRTFYNRHKNGEPLFPTSFKRSANVLVNNNSVNSKGNFSNNLATGVLNGAIAPAMAAIGKGSFIGNIAASAVSGAVIPLVKEFINSGNKIQFSEIDTEMNKWIADKKYWISQRAKIDNGIFPIKSIAGGFIGGILGWLSGGNSSESKRNAIIGSVILGGAGIYLDQKENQNLQMNGQALADHADAMINQAEQNIQRLRQEKVKVKEWVEADILTESENGVYTINNEVLNEIISADKYRSMNIPVIRFKGAYKYLLGEAREKFYKIVTGLPEQGKTSYCVKFATYFAKNHGKVLYLPAEQSGKNLDFKKVLNRVDGTSFDIDPNVNSYSFEQLIVRIKNYDLVVLDSVNYMKLSAEQLKEINSKVCIMAVMQSTKSGSFKGSQEYFHDCDKFVVVDKLAVSVSKSRGTDPKEIRESIEIDNLKI